MNMICCLGFLSQNTTTGISLRDIMAIMDSLYATITWLSYFSRTKTFSKDEADGYIWRMLITSTNVWCLIWRGGAGGVSV